MPAAQLRSAKLEDGAVIYSMICELENEPLEKREFEKIYAANLDSDSIHYIVAESDKHVVGFMSLHIQKLLHHNGPVAEIQELFVDSDMRGSGIGKQLIDRAKQVASEKGCKVLEVTCNMKRESTHRFYEREGLVRTHYKFTEELPGN